MDVNNPEIIIAGCGPGSPDYLTEATRKAVEGAEVLVGAGRLLDLFPSHEAEKIVVAADTEEVLKAMELRRHKKIVVLVTGDPGLCSLARPALKRFGRKSCRVIPGISAVQTAFARVGLDWLDARTIDAHGQNPCMEIAALKKERKIAVLTGHGEAILWLADTVKELGNGWRIFICENLTLADENIRQVQEMDLAEIQVAARSVVLIIKEEELK